MQARNRSKSRREGAVNGVSSASSSNKRKRDTRQKQPERRNAIGRIAWSSLFSLLAASVALLAGIFQKTGQENGPFDGAVHSFLSSFVCKDDGGGYCHDSLVPSRRTQKSLRYIHPGEVVLVVPRHLQIWDLDAMRDPSVYGMFKARHEHTNNPLDSGAFLAAYLARRFRLMKQNSVEPDDHMRPYFDVLPLYKDLVDHHPVLWTETELAHLLGRHSSAFAVAKGYRDMVLSEYKALSSVSDEFATMVSEKDYKTMRIHVMSRSFGPGPPGEEEALESVPLHRELELYKAQSGIDLSMGCRSMVPILDMYDHHARPNVEWRYQSEKRAFVIHAASQGISPGYDVMDSYGKYTDAHLFAKFGFVNGDGSGYTEANIGILHKSLDVDMKQQFSYMPLDGITENMQARQKRDLIRYLQFDDGYEECIQEEHVDAYELKRLKFQNLIQIANMPDRWILRMPPRDASSKPAISSNVRITTKPPRFDHRNLQFDGSKLISTCRLMTLTHDDFDGHAINILREVLNNNTAETFMIGRQSDDLEFRALSCLARLSGIVLSRFDRTVTEEAALVSTLTEEAFQSRNWTTSHVRLGEMQTLELLQGISMSGMRQLGKTLEITSKKVPFIRKKPCPFEYSMSLL